MPSRSSGGRPETAGAEQRVAPRKRVERDVRIRLADRPDDEPLAARLCDVSASGIGLRLMRPVPPGKEFILELSDAREDVSALRYRAARCRPLGNGLFLVGAAFVRKPAA
jgi:PilZ domain